MKFIERFPSLEDKVGSTSQCNGGVTLSGFMEKKLTDRFKFVRRRDKSDGDSPLPKRQKRMCSDEGPLAESFEDKLDLLNAECKKKKRQRSMATIFQLTSDTLTEGSGL